MIAERVEPGVEQAGREWSRRHGVATLYRTFPGAAPTSVDSARDFGARLAGCRRIVTPTPPSSLLLAVSQQPPVYLSALAHGLYLRHREIRPLPRGTRIFLPPSTPRAPRCTSISPARSLKSLRFSIEIILRLLVRLENSFLKRLLLELYRAILPGYFQLKTCAFVCEIYLL